MCGIYGAFSTDAERPIQADLLERMGQVLAHRGPDGEGRHLAGPLGMGMRRLSIIDLTGGDQPIANEDGTVWVVFNGEIYNYRELTADLSARGHRFATSSDTEVLVHLYEEYGERCVEPLRGMFAFAVWDGKKDASGELKEKGSQKAVSSWWYFRAEAPPDYSGYYYAALAVGLALGFQFVLIRKLKKGHSA